jgi:molybdenum cofactor sulfurtransferase
MKLKFYHLIFRYPTGLGALLVSRRGAKVLRSKQYYGGGTVQVVLASEKNFHVKRDQIVGRLEDGTIPFLSIIALSKSFEYMDRIIPLNSEENFIVRISKHVFNLAKYTYENMKEFKHYNGKPVIKFYQETDFSDRSRQGGVINFNVMRSDDSFVGFSEVGFFINTLL